MYRHKIEHGSYSKSEKAVAVAAVLQHIMTPIAGVSPEVLPYQAPYTVVTNGGNRLDKEKKCPEDSPFVALNSPGIGNNKVGVYASGQVEEILEGEKDAEKICYVGFVYGTEYDLAKNTDALRDFIIENKPTRLIVFATSFGGMAMVDVLNEYHRRYPDDTTEFALVLLSSPAEADDLQLFTRLSSEALSVTPMGRGAVYSMTVGSILGQGDKSPFDGKTWSDSSIAASDTPPHLLQEEIRKLLTEGMNSLEMDIPVYAIMDPNDEVINAERSIQSTNRRIGHGVVFMSMTHKDGRMEYHGALWWPDNREDYVVPVKDVIAEANEALDKQRNANMLVAAAKNAPDRHVRITIGDPERLTKEQIQHLARSAVEGKVTLVISPPQP